MFPWRKIWAEFGKWCDSQDEYPYEWWQQEPVLQAIIKKYRPKKYNRTYWRKIWSIFADRYEEKFFASWRLQKQWIGKLVEQYSVRIK